jgi:putative transposase
VKRLKTTYPNVTNEAYTILRTSRGNLKYKSIKDDVYLINQLTKLSQDHPREGFWKSYNRMRNKGDKADHKRLHRDYKQIGLPLRRKVKKRLTSIVKEPLEVPTSFNHTWSIDFVHNMLKSGRKFSSFNVNDNYNRKVLFIETDYSIKIAELFGCSNTKIINMESQRK